MKRFTVWTSDDAFQDVSVGDADFGYDASLQLTGDFATTDEKIRYAQAVADALNAWASTIPVRREQR